MIFFIRYFDADRCLARYRCFDSDIRCRKVQLDVVCKVYNFTYLYTHLRLKFITGNRRTTAYIRHCDIDTEIVQRIL